MRPQWSEGAALLAFIPLSAAPPRRRLAYRRPAMNDLRYALIRQGPTDLETGPIGCESLPALARAIERERQGRTIELVEREDFEFQTDDLLHTVVEVWTLDMGNSRDSRIAVAWLNEGGREILEPALYAARNDVREKAQPRRRAA